MQLWQVCRDAPEFATERTIALVNGYLEELLDAEFAEMQAEADDTWKDASLLGIANYKNGLAMQKFRPQSGDKGLPVLKIRELGQGECGSDAERCSSDIEDSVHVRDGDLIFSWSGTLMLDFWAGGDAGLNQHLFKVTSDKYPSWFYYMWTKHHMRRFIAMAKDRATTMGHIKRSALANAAVKIPPSDVLRSQTKAMQPLVDEVVGLKIQSRKLANLRDALLPKLMSGEIDVSKVDLTPPNSHLAEKSIDDILRCVYQPHLPFNFSAYLTGRKFLVCRREGVLGCKQLLPAFFLMHIGTCLFQR